MPLNQLDQYNTTTMPNSANDTNKPIMSTSNRNLNFTIIFSIYTLQGFLLIISNGAVEFVIAKHRHLRRRYIILLAQIFTDVLAGLALCTAGIGRLITMAFGSSRVSRQNCLLRPWSMIATWSDPLSAMANLLVSTDRLIAVAFPKQYYWYYYSYQIRQIIFFFCPIYLFGLLAWISSFRDNKTTISNLCWTGDVLLPFYADATVFVMITSSLLSVLLYGAVYLITRKHVRRIRNQQNQGTLQTFELRQRKLTATMGISCMFTLVFYVLPMCLKYLIIDNDSDPATHYSNFVRVVAAISCNLNPLTNIIAILVRHEDIASCMMRLFPNNIQKRIPKCSGEWIFALCRRYSM